MRQMLLLRNKSMGIREIFMGELTWDLEPDHSKQ